jgi:hypothetical protein
MNKKIKVDSTIIVHSGVDMTKMMEKDYSSNVLQFIDLSDVNIFVRVFRRVTFKILPTLWVKYIFRKVNTVGACNIILFDSILTNYLCQYVRNRFPDSKVRFWLWNVIDKKSIEYIKLHSDNVYSFDPKQCSDYGLHFISQFIPYNIDRLNSPLGALNNRSVAFVGADKGRLSKILDLANKFDNFDCKVNFFVKTKSKPSGSTISFSNEGISYSESLRIYKSSSAILDLNKKGQTGVSLRPIEALFLSKKLITNNCDIKRYPFYTKSNIFILDRDNEEQLLSFINTPFEKVSQKILEQYEFKSWLKQILDIDCVSVNVSL